MALEGLFEEVRAALLERHDTPLATYRLQINSEFRLEDVRRLVPYLARLGISAVYASPLLRAAPGSAHGYDVIDHGTLNPEVGTEEDFAALAAELRRHGMGLVLDTVPNHMGIEKGRNALWNDVLENGQASTWARYFDIDWDPVKVELKGKVLLPILGDQYGEVLERGELRLEFEGGCFHVRYFDHVFPVAPKAYAPILRLGLPELEKRLGPEDLDVIELQSILTAIDHLPPPAPLDHARALERNREKEVIKRRLSALTERSAEIRTFIERNVVRFNGTPGEPSSFDLLDEVLSVCSYRLAHWRVAGEEINYRRFFDINGLAAIRVEDRQVFDESHALVFRWIAEGKVTGLRIDHPDGLFDPTAYFLRLQEEYFLSKVRERRPESTRGTDEREAAWLELEHRIRERYRAEFDQDSDSPLYRALYVVVEKIQGGRERIPEAWAVHGTTGYRFANMVTGLFVARESESALTRIYERFIGRPMDFDALVYAKKKLVTSSSMSSEINVLAHELNRISEMNRRTRDFTLNSLRRALLEFVALFPVYRTYVDHWRALDDRDVQYIRWTIARARKHDPTTAPSLYDFLQDILLRNHPTHLGERERAVMLRFAMKLQQVTGPVMAKGLEDTVFYVYNRLVALNEVGAEPERFGASLNTFHLRNQERAEKWPAALLASTTHDTKRSEDVRARLTVISEVPEEWKNHLRRWSRINRRHKVAAGDRLAPRANDEYLFYQTVIGAWPMGEPMSPDAFAEFRWRMGEYMLKAIREAKEDTSWVNPDQPYEEAMQRFVERVLDPRRNPVFVESAEAFKRRLEKPGQFNALAATQLKLACPGTTDVYQGAELWDLSLVDPDNRRPVDFERRMSDLNALLRDAEVDRENLVKRLLDTLSTGRIKLYVLAEGLRLRNRRPALFRSGSYLALEVVGPRSEHAVAFARNHQKQWVVSVVPRKSVPLLDANGGMRAALEGTLVQLPEALEGMALRDVYTGRTFTPERRDDVVVLDVGALLALFPVSLLETDLP
ncbi:MAG: malto-oligosyltrehalose synthase [Myxococcaceae bacterium]